MASEKVFESSENEDDWFHVGFDTRLRVVDVWISQNGEVTYYPLSLPEAERLAEEVAKKLQEVKEEER